MDETTETGIVSAMEAVTDENGRAIAAGQMPQRTGGRRRSTWFRTRHFLRETRNSSERSSWSCFNEPPTIAALSEKRAIAPT